MVIVKDAMFPLYCTVLSTFPCAGYYSLRSRGENNKLHIDSTHLNIFWGGTHGFLIPPYPR
jgi:hypothetical protein